MYLGEIIKKYRTEHGMSQQAFADKCALSKPYISQLENNYNPKTGEPGAPSTETFVKVAKAMDMPLAELLKVVDQNQPIALKEISDISPTYEAAAGNDTEMMDLTASETDLINYYRQLNEDGQDKVSEYAGDLVSSGRYKKHPDPNYLSESEEKMA